MTPVWREESEEVKCKVHLVELEMQSQQQRMRSWYADESATMAVREEARAEAWLSQVWARAEAQAEKEVDTVRAMHQRLVQCMGHTPKVRSCDGDVQQRVWRVEAQAEETAARELALRDAQAALERQSQEQLAEVEAQHVARCRELQQQGLEAARRESEEQEMQYMQRLKAAERSRDEALAAVETLETRSAALWEEQMAQMERRELRRPCTGPPPREPIPMVSDSFDREVLGKASRNSGGAPQPIKQLLDSWGGDYCKRREATTLESIGSRGSACFHTVLQGTARHSTSVSDCRCRCRTVRLAGHTWGCCGVDGLALGSTCRPRGGLRATFGGICRATTARSSRRKTAMDYALEAGHVEIFELLSAATAVANAQKDLGDAQVDFFGSMGKEREKDGKLKPDPEKVKVSEKEYNPFLRGEESNLPVPESASASSIPKDLCVGAAWAGKNDWRKRAQRRQAADNERDEPRKQAASPSRSPEPCKARGAKRR
ncbi:unnamed protein product [Effrenium voratum]|nr:unnamed protein product [Effrenium voratum]